METAQPPGRAPDRGLFALMLGVFLGGGLLNATVALLVPRLSTLAGLGLTEAASAQLAYYASYLLFALPAAALLVRWGAGRAMAGGLAVMAIGCALLALALLERVSAMLFLALLLVSSGVTLLQITGNGVMATMGAGATRRFTLLQAFNSLGTVLGPLLASRFLLDPGAPGGAAPPFLAGAVLFALLGAGFALRARSLPPRGDDLHPSLGAVAGLMTRSPRLMFGATAIFAYVGAEVSIAAFAVAYLTRPDRLGVDAIAAGRLVSLYWAGAMAGRFAGVVLLRRIPAARLLAGAAALALLLILVAGLATGLAGSAALLALGLANAIMFPTIFALAMPEREGEMPIASMLLCMAVVGGALVPVAAGAVADTLSVPAALLVPGLCYALIFAFARQGAGWRS
ncbi:MFS transporter [Sphingomonas morindae]|uniref:MFS transporter n=1 Tax=Sphingomonas morindae TaxID=1541170 RepID=A0ABY4XCB9_9SPHN|nr:MFS transporter [Sphingomonas morindae]USI74596.1 MFS transporter [Sphingomonas morindae]